MQLEVQQLKRAEQQKDRQLAETRRSSQLFEEDLQAEQQQKEATWEHNRVPLKLFSTDFFFPLPLSSTGTLTAGHHIALAGGCLLCSHVVF